MNQYANIQVKQRKISEAGISSDTGVATHDLHIIGDAQIIDDEGIKDIDDMYADDKFEDED